MPRALISVAAFVTAGAAGTVAVAAAPGDTLAVPSFSLSSKARLLQVYGDGPDIDFVRVRSPRMHDPNQGLRLRVPATTLQPLLPWEVSEVLYPSDVPTYEVDVTAASSAGILFTEDFDDLPGGNPRLAGLADIQGRVVHISGVEVDTAGGAIGSWSAGVALNADFDNFKAGSDYALLGYEVSVATMGVAVSGQDTGNYKIGGPGDPNPYRTRDYFVRMSEYTGRPCIPIIAADNKQSTNVQNVDIAANTAVKTTLILAELA